MALRGHYVKRFEGGKMHWRPASSISRPAFGQSHSRCVGANVTERRRDREWLVGIFTTLFPAYVVKGWRVSHGCQPHFKSLEDGGGDKPGVFQSRAIRTVISRLALQTRHGLRGRGKRADVDRPDCRPYNFSPEALNFTACELPFRGSIAKGERNGEHI